MLLYRIFGKCHYAIVEVTFYYMLYRIFGKCHYAIVEVPFNYMYRFLVNIIVPLLKCPFTVVATNCIHAPGGDKPNILNKVYLCTVQRQFALHFTC